MNPSSSAAWSIVAFCWRPVVSPGVDVHILWTQETKALHGQSGETQALSICEDYFCQVKFKIRPVVSSGSPLFCECFSTETREYL